MEAADPFQGLTEKQKEDTLNLMQIAAIEKPEVAKHFMEMCNFDVNAAVSCYLENGEGGAHQNAQQPQQQEQYQPPPPQQQMFNDDYNQPQFTQQQAYGFLQQAHQASNQQQIPSDVNQEQLEKYKKFKENKKVLEQNNSLVKKVGSGIVSTSKSLWNSLIPVGFRGETLGGEEFIQFVQRNLKIKDTYNFQNGSFQESMDKADVMKRPVLVFIYQDSCPTKKLQIKLLQDRALKLEFNKSFYCMGILNTSEEANKILKHLKSDQWPALAIFRKNLFEQSELISGISIKLQNEDPAYYLTKVKEARSQYYLKMSEENKVIKAEKQMSRPQHNPFMMDEQAYYYMQQQNSAQANRERELEQKMRLEEERRIKKQQEEEYQEMIRQSEEQEKKRWEEEQKKQEEEVQKIIQQQLREEELKQKKDAVVEEPAADASDIITILFRLPDGTKIQRRFLQSHTGQNVHDFIETNEDIKFEAEERKFDLIQTHPPLNISNKLGDSLKDIFDESEYELLNVREL